MSSKPLKGSSTSRRASKSPRAAELPVIVKPGPPLSQLSVPENLRFRQMELRDAASVFHLGEEVFNADTFPQLYRTWDAFEVTEMLATDSELCIIAEEVQDGSSESDAKGGKIVGFAFGSITEKRKREHSCGLLGWVGVAPSHQRKNIGTILVSKLFNLFLEDDIHLIIADTPQENHPAIRFLERMGFASPVSHVYMSLNLSKSHHPKESGANNLPAEAKAIKLRPMTIDDLSAVHDLGEQIYDATLFPNLYRIWSEAEVVEMFGSDSENCVVAVLEGKVVGWVMGTTIAKSRSSWKYGYLVWLGVAPEVQRYGVGRKLFNAFYDLMVEEGCRIIMIDTQADNLPARKFFERAGFGSLESHIYVSKTLGPDDAIASEERITRSGSGNSTDLATTKARGGLKASRLFKFKRSHSLLEASRSGGGGAIIGDLETDHKKPASSGKAKEEKAAPAAAAAPSPNKRAKKKEW